MTDHEQLSMLLDDELSGPESQALRQRIESEPALARAWETMQQLPDALAGLPELAPPPGLDELVLGRAAAPAAAAPAGWQFAPLLALAAALLLSLAWPRATPELLLVAGHQRITGDVSLLAGDVRVSLDGTADLFVEPPPALLRETQSEDPNMTKQQLLAGLTGAIVTVAVYEGTAVLYAADGNPVRIAAGERQTVTPQTPLSPTPRQVTTRTTEASPDAAALQAEIDALSEQLEAAQLQKALARGQLASYQGAPQAWPDDAPEALRAEGFSERLAAALADMAHLELVSVDCDEYPCFAVIESHSDSDDWGDDLDAVGQSLKEAYGDALGDEVGVGHWRSEIGRDGDNVRLEGLVIAGPGTDDADNAARTNYRIESAVEDAADERMDEQTQGSTE